MLSSTLRMAAVVVLALSTTSTVQAINYQILFNHSGENFFDDWIFYNGIDVNNTGNVLFQTQQQAQQLGIIGLNSAGNTIVKVDNTTSGVGDPTFGRPSVKLLSSYTITKGNLVIFDAVHLPFGCSVWPAFWSQGPVWPDDGEIDIMEGANLQTQNQISLHTLDGCTHPSADASTGTETGTLVSTDCFNQTDFNEGCIVGVGDNSYGAGFASVGGGVYSLLWDDTGLSFWFFQRAQIPADMATNTPNPAGWGTPTAFYPQSSCNTDQFIKPQTLILDITICGNFALNVFSQTCSGSCLDLVQTPSNYDDAYFEIKYIRVFEQTNSTPTSLAPSPTASATGSAGVTGTPGSSSGSGSGSSSAATAAAKAYGGVVMAGTAALCLVAAFLVSA